MGLFSDYLEQCRSRDIAGEIDPCMIMSNHWGGNFHYRSYYQEIDNYSSVDTSKEEKRRIRQELIMKSAELERLKSGYLVAEKVLLEIENKRILRSDLVKDTLKILCDQLHKSYQEICDLRQEIDKKLDYPNIPRFEPQDEMVIRKDMLKRLMNSMLCYMEEGVIGNTGTCRKVVSDCSEIIRSIEQEKYSQANKEVFSYYLERAFHVRRIQHRCNNCHETLYENIPYCLNCYERNM